MSKKIISKFLIQLFVSLFAGVANAHVHLITRDA